MLRVIFLGLITTTIWLPAKTAVFDFSYIEPMTVSISKNSPPRAILEDELLAPLKIMPQFRPQLKPGQVRLVAGESSKEIVISSLVKERSRVQEALQKSQEPQPMENHIEVAREVKNLETEPLRLTAQEVQTASLDSSQKNHNEQIPDFGEAFKNTTRVKEKSETESSETRKPDDLLIDTEVVRNHFPENPMKPQGQIALNNPSPSIPVDPSHVQDPNLLADARNASSRLNAKAVQQALVSGHIELSNGLGFTSDSTLEVFHDIAGQQVAAGQVSIAEGTYQILIQNVREGQLVAELRDQDGFLLGRDVVEVEELLRDATLFKQEKALVLVPVNSGLEGKTKSVYSNNDKGEADVVVTLPGLTLSARTAKTGEFAQSSLLHDSEVIIQTKRAGYWGTVLMTDNSKKMQVPLYPNNMIRALAELIDAGSDYADYGIVYGKVEINGRASEGATVEMEDETVIGPIYFNALQLPDTNLEATSSNGLFAFLKVEPGLHLVRAKKDEKNLPSKTVLTDAGSVTPVAIEITGRKKARALVYDALTGQMLPSRIEFMGADRSVLAPEGVVGVKYHSGSDLMFMEAEVESQGSYFTARQTLSRTVNHINFPMVRHEWLDDFANKARINRIPDTGVIVGFVKGAEFEVMLPESLIGSELLYFDHLGQYSGKISGPRDGGFVILNANQGIHTIGISAAKQKGFASKLIFSDTRAVNLINYKF